jgi:anti-sigma regulatory factor (Ser/Thr protein kinase)
MGALAISDCMQGKDPLPFLPHAHGDPGAGGRWVRRTFLELGALPTAVPCARLHVRQVLWEWGRTTPAETVELITSELVTNAVHASQGLTGSRFAGRWAPGLPPVRLWMTADRRCVVAQVWDGNHQAPVVQGATLDAESGRGLLLVESLSADWGTYTPENSGGKVVWAAVDDPR